MGGAGFGGGVDGGGRLKLTGLGDGGKAGSEGSEGGF